MKLYPFYVAAERRQSIGFDWHRECLQCQECGKVLNPGQHAEVMSETVLHCKPSTYLVITLFVAQDLILFRERKVLCNSAFNVQIHIHVIILKRTYLPLYLWNSCLVLLRYFY